MLDTHTTRPIIRMRRCPARSVALRVASLVAIAAWAAIATGVIIARPNGHWGLQLTLITNITTALVAWHVGSAITRLVADRGRVLQLDISHLQAQIAGLSASMRQHEDAVAQISDRHQRIQDDIVAKLDAAQWATLADVAEAISDISDREHDHDVVRPFPRRRPSRGGR